jgi:hypothetical protein
MNPKPVILVILDGKICFATRADLDRKGHLKACVNNKTTAKVMLRTLNH